MWKTWKALLLVVATYAVSACGGGSGGSAGTDELEDDGLVIPEVVGSWQNTLVAENFWLITEDSVTNFGNFPPSPCFRQEANILSATTFTIDQGTGAGSLFTMSVENEQLFLQAPGILLASHNRINASDIPEACIQQIPLRDNFLRYTDTFIQIDYPAEWTLNTNVNNVNAMFVSTEVSAAGGNVNSTVNTVFQPNSDLGTLTDEFLLLINFESTPEMTFPT